MKYKVGDTVMVRGVIKRKPGPLVAGHIISVDEEKKRYLVPTREYGRRWFGERGTSFQIVSEA